MKILNGFNVVLQNAKFLMHDGSNFVYNSGAKAQDQMEFQKKVEERVKQYILSRSKLTSEEYDSKLVAAPFLLFMLLAPLAYTLITPSSRDKTVSNLSLSPILFSLIIKQSVVS